MTRHLSFCAIFAWIVWMCFITIAGVADHSGAGFYAVGFFGGLVVAMGGMCTMLAWDSIYRG